MSAVVWWGWALIGWFTVAAVAALWLGAALAAADRLDRDGRRLSDDRADPSGT